MDRKLSIAVETCICAMFITGERMEDFFAKLAIDTLDSFDEEKRCRFEDQRKETWIYSGPVSLIVVREKMLEFYSDQLLN